MTFPSIRIEGAILSGDLLAKLDKGDFVGQRPADFGFDSQAKLKEEIVRAWTAAQAFYTAFQHKLEGVKEGTAATSETRNQWIIPLLGLLGYAELEFQSQSELVGDKPFRISHHLRSHGGFHVHIVGARESLDKKPTTGPRVSPHAHLQEYLNLTEHLYGIVTNGKLLRLLRDSTRLIKLSYVEFDLDRMFGEELFADFAVLYRLLHVTRLPRSPEKSAESLLERYHQDALESGARIRDGLSFAVEQVVQELGSGFLARNENLRGAVADNSVTARELHHALLRLIYRLLLMMVAEERGLLFTEAATPRQRKLYLDYYSINRLRRLAERRALADSTKHDLWRGLRSTFRLFETDGPGAPLGLTGLGGQLFSAAALGPLQVAELDNGILLSALAKLSLFRQPDTGQLSRVNYGALATEEFGSVYERLLELHPVIHPATGNLPPTFGFRQAAGNERKTSGSYYTPSSLVECLLDSALDPVLDDRLKNFAKLGYKSADEAVLALKVCDPACGSGHFLIAAAQRIARRLALLRSKGDEPSVSELRHTLREVIGHCVYGVDANTMSVELCKVALWLEAMEAGKPLSFLDHHIRYGNSLLGATPALIAKGIPDDAFTAIEGDDKKACAALRKLNARERRGFGELFVLQDRETFQRLQQAAVAVENLPDDSVRAVEQKSAAFAQLQHNYDFQNKKLVADTWCVAFVIRKFFHDPNNVNSAVGITQRLLNELSQGQQLSEGIAREISRLITVYNFFHWHLEFPEVFAHDGFDVVLGNPPWEKVELLQREWFASARPDLTSVPAGKEKETLLRELQSTDPKLHEAFIEALRAIDGERAFVQNSGRYPLCGQGRINSYAAFAETNLLVLSPTGLIGCVLPPGIATDDSTKFFIQHVVENEFLKCFFAFTNRGYIFPAIESTLSFALIVYGKLKTTCPQIAAQIWQVEHLKDEGRVYSLDKETIRRINPNTLNLPILQSSRDAALVSSIHKRVPILDHDAERGGHHEKIEFRQGLFNMTSDKKLFSTAEQLLGMGGNTVGNFFSVGGEVYQPLYEAKFTSQFNHRHGTFDGVPATERFGTRAQTNKPTTDQLQNPYWCVLPRYWVTETEMNRAVPQEWQNHWLLGFRNAISAVADSRSVAFAIIPKVGVGNSMPLLFCQTAEATSLLANFNSFVLDYVGRQKASGGNLNFYVVKQLPILPANTYVQACAWSSGGQTLKAWLLPRVLELTYTAWDLEAFAQDSGWFGPPFCWDEERRFQLRCELDASFFHLYGLNRDDTAYILDTFPIVKRKDEEKHGHYRTKDRILEIYDALAEAQHTSRDYVSQLKPAPASMSAAHPWSWENKPLELPATLRAPLPENWQYVVNVMVELLWQAGGSLSWRVLRSATDLLSDRNRLARLAELHVGQVALDWLALNGDSFDATHRWDQLSGFCHAGKMRVVRRDGELIVELLSTEGHLLFPHVRFDARLALTVSRPLPAEAPTPASLQDERRVAELIPA